MIPTHVAIIPDGNRRWARAKGKSVMEGHEAGAEAFRTIALHAADRGVKHLSVWGLSLENAKKRSLREMAGLMNIFRKQFMSLKNSHDIHSRKVKINVFGGWQKQFPERVKREIQEAITATEHHGSYFLNFFLAYSGTNEMVLAMQNILRDQPGQVTDETIKRSLFTKDLPPVDLVIRTGGEPHLSAGFMMWDVADAELYFPEVYWPDFTPAEFDKALDFYAARDRRFGK